VVGVTDVLAKSKGSSNPHNLVKSYDFGIERDQEIHDTIAQNRGIINGKKCSKDK
jgi:small subunit ribosomal protein S5